VDKVIDSPKAAVADMRDGITVTQGGFGLGGIPENLIAAVTRKQLRYLCATVAEVEELPEPGELDPDQVVTPRICADRVAIGPEFIKPAERRFIRERAQL
jgi:acyl CoA:acetate/3-ketoacid CoA transferase alpha subunit